MESTISKAREWVADLRSVLLAHADADNAASMKKYMRGQFDYFGVKSPLRTELTRPFFRKEKLPPIESVEAVVKLCWKQKERDFQYLGANFMEKHIKKMGPEAIPLIEFMITQKSWWDTVDLVATHHAGGILKKFPELIPEVTERWMTSGNMWLQRSALLFQLKYKGDTDTELLYDLIGRLNGSKEFFINKAIGWVLREYSKTNPESVRQFMAGITLPPLSVREGSKYI